MKIAPTQKKVRSTNHSKITLVSLAFLYLLTGCSKQKETCYECKAMLEKKDHQVVIESSNSTTSYCDKSDAEIKALEKERTYKTTENGIETESTFKCTLK